MSVFSLSGLTSMMTSLECLISSARWLGRKSRSVLALVRNGGHQAAYEYVLPSRERFNLSAYKPRHQFPMRGVAELIHRRHALEPVAAADQNPRVSRKRRDVAGHRNHQWNFAGCKLDDLRLCALPH